MDRRVKERLVGAAILVAAVVLIAPELLSGPKPAPKLPGGPPPTASAAPVRSYSVDVAENGSAAAPVENSVVARGGAAAGVVVRAGGADDERAAPSAGGAAAAPGGTRLADPTEIKRPAAHALEAEKSAPTEDGAGRQGWTVQLGSFAELANARKLVRDLNSKGFSAFVLWCGSVRGRIKAPRSRPPRS